MRVPSHARKAKIQVVHKEALNAPTLLALEGGARLREPVVNAIASVYPGAVLLGSPLELVLRGEVFDPCMAFGMILMGQSFGVAVARHLAARLELSGCPARALVALDCRCVERKNDVPVLPPALRRMTSASWRSNVEEIHFVAARVPRLDLTARHFVPRFQLEPETGLQVVSAWAVNLPEADHFDIAMACWDLARQIQKTGSKRRRSH